MNEFEIVHRYRRLAARDAVPDLHCTTCDHPLIVRLGEDDKPDLKCYTCGIRTTIGLKALMSMEHAIKNYETQRNI